MSDVEVLREVPQRNRGRAAELYWDAFGRKLGPALGPAARGIEFLTTHLNPDRGVCAVVDGRLVGLAGYQHAGRALMGGSARDVLRAYGGLHGVPRLALLAVLSRRPARDELVMDGIAVDRRFRGRGIGSLLLTEIAAVAGELGCRRIRLDVIDVNPRARALYERRGFVATHTEQTPYLRRILGFGAVTTMRLEVAA